MEISHQEHFKKWMDKNGINSQSSYLTYLRNIQKYLEANVADLAKLPLTEAVATITAGNFPKERNLNDSRSAFKAYHKFYQERFNKLPFNRRAEFEEWLKAENFSSHSISGYVAHVNSIQKKFATDIDEIVANGIEEPLKKINHKNFTVGVATISDKKAILKKYYKFYLDTKK